MICYVHLLIKGGNGIFITCMHLGGLHLMSSCTPWESGNQINDLGIAGSTV